MIYDCFTYWNENELLFLRLKHLWKYVDHFVIVEANITHRGRPKEWNLEKLLDNELAWAKEKIIYIQEEIDASQYNLNYSEDGYNPNSDFWKIENAQRNAIEKGLRKAKPDDIIMIGDLDEFPRENIMLYMHQVLEVGKYQIPVTLEMGIFNYYFNVKNEHRWKGTIIGKKFMLDYPVKEFIKKKFLISGEDFDSFIANFPEEKMQEKTSPQLWRDNRSILPCIYESGYHFSWIGKERIFDKLQNTAHHELSKRYDKSDIEKWFVPKNDVFSNLVESTNSFLVDLNTIDYPKAIIDNRKKYPHLFYDKRPKIALCYWGLSRSAKFVHDSHESYIFDVLRKSGIEYDVFMHTWNMEYSNDYFLLKPTFCQIDDQEKFSKNIEFEKYFYKEVFQEKGESVNGEWFPEMIKNCILGLESQRRVTKLCLSSEEKYDYVIYIRPDSRIFKQFPLKMINQIEKNEIGLVDFHSFEGYNDQFAIVRYESCERYGFRITELAKYRETQGRIVPEKFLKFIIDTYYKKIHYLDFNFALIRFNNMQQMFENDSSSASS